MNRHNADRFFRYDKRLISLLVVYRWISLWLAFLAFPKFNSNFYSEPAALALAAFLIIYNLLVSLFSRRLSNTIAKQPYLLVIDSFMTLLLLTIVLRWESILFTPYLLNPIIAASLLFGMAHGFIISLFSSFFYVDGVYLNGYFSHFQKLSPPFTHLQPFLYFIAAVVSFGFLGELIKRTDEKLMLLKEQRQNLTQAQEHLRKINHKLTILHQANLKLEDAPDHKSILDILVAVTKELGFPHAFAALFNSNNQIALWSSDRESAIKPGNGKPNWSSILRLPFTLPLTFLYGDNLGALVVGDNRPIHKEDRVFLDLLLAGASLVLSKISFLKKERQLSRLKERNRIALEIHDTSLQTLSGALFIIQAMRESIKKGKPISSDKIRILRITLKESLASLQPTIFDLNFSDQGELSVDIENFIKKFSPRQNVPIEFNVNGEEKNLSPKVRRSLFFIVQESLTNVVKHAKASKVRIDLNYNNDLTALSIEDNGRGFNIDQKKREAKVLNKLGLESIAVHVKEIEGNLTINSSLGIGSKLSVSFNNDEEKP